MRPRAAWGVALLTLVSCAGSDREEVEPQPEGERPIVALGEVDTVTVRPGGAATVVVPVVVAEGYKVQANPAADEFLVPLELRLTADPSAGIELAAPKYPPPGRHRLTGAQSDLLTYESTVPVSVPLTAAPDARTGESRIQGELRYQACDARRCYFPASVPVEFGVLVSE